MVFMMLCPSYIFCQQDIEVGAYGSSSFPLSRFKFNLDLSIEQSGGVIRNGWGSNAFILHHPSKHLFYGVSFDYSQFQVVYESPNSDINAFIQNSSNPSKYNQNKYSYDLSGTKWHLIRVDIPMGLKYSIKHFSISGDIRSGIVTVLAPDVDVNQISSGPFPNQIHFDDAIDRFSAKPNILFEYGGDIKVGYEVYKHLNAFAGFSYAGTTNAHLKYFDNPPYGYKKTIQTMGVNLGLSYDIPLKSVKSNTGTIRQD
jgi:hypothetical protein